MADREKVIKGLECCRRGFCFSCPYNDGVDENVECKQRWADDALSLLKAQEPGWISVKDRLPELNKEVMVYAVGKIEGFTGRHAYALCDRFVQHVFPSSPGHERWSTPWEYFHTDYEITHWMPLPEPPKEET